MRPIQAGSGEQLDIAAIDPRVHAVAVVLNLAQPTRTRRRFRGAELERTEAVDEPRIYFCYDDIVPDPSSSQCTNCPQSRHEHDL